MEERRKNRDSEIVEKNIPPIHSITSSSTCKFADLQKTIVSLIRIATAYIQGSIICSCDTLLLTPESIVKIYCPIEQTNKVYKAEGYCHEVLQRVDVASTIYHGDACNMDLQATMTALQGYIQSRELTPISTYRIVFHKEKRQWKSNLFAKPSNKGAIVEVQQYIEKKSESE